MANDNNGGDDWSLYPYEPVKAAPIVFAVLLTVIGIYQIYQSFFKYHWKKFGGIMTWVSFHHTPIPTVRRLIVPYYRPPQSGSLVSSAAPYP